MSGWAVSEADLKNYSHFDKFVPIEEIMAIVTDPDRVKTNKFYPFLRYVKSWNKFANEGEVNRRKEKRKERPIRYAARRDAYIFSYYRHLLALPYEKHLVQLGLSNCVLAYRKIPVDGVLGRGKCNIHFANDAFSAIHRLGDCSVVALDISSYFESIDHERLKQIWCRLIGVLELPPDHQKVFEAITRYAVVDRDRAYERLGYRQRRPNGSFELLTKKIPMQLCDPTMFRAKICGQAEGFKSLIEVNRKPYGIPQGSPISDLLANAYLIDFDSLMKKYADQAGGIYLRYSDDILIIVPGDRHQGRAAKDHAISLIGQFGNKLVIQQRKTSLLEFKTDGDRQCYEWIAEDGTTRTNGLEYLGFRYTGDRVYLRDSTLSSFHRKIAFSARRATRKFVARYPGKDLSFLIDSFDNEKFISRFGRVEDFDECKDYHSWTFWTYAKRAADVFGPKGQSIHGQLGRHRSQIRKRIEHELARAFRKSKEI